NGASTATAAQIYGPAVGVDMSGSRGSVANFASITAGSATGSPGIGVRLEAGGRVTNGASGGTAAQIAGLQAGVDISGNAGTVVNNNSISAIGNDGVGVKLEAGGTFVN